MRSSMGAGLRFPVFTQSWEELGPTITSSKLDIYVADCTKSSLSLYDANLRSSCAIVLGSEAVGVSPEVNTSISHLK